MTLTVDIRNLTPDHKSEVGAHFEGMSENDRITRFLGYTTPSSAKEYGEKMIFKFGGMPFGLYVPSVSDGRSILAGVGVVIFGHNDTRVAEISLSVASEYQKRHYGKALMLHGLALAKNNGASKVHFVTKSTNVSMVKLGNSCQFTIEDMGYGQVNGTRFL